MKKTKNKNSTLVSACFDNKKKKSLFKGFLLFNEIAIFISWLSCPVRIFGFRMFKIKDYTCIFFNKDIFNYGNRKSDSIWVQIESLLTEKPGFGVLHTAPLDNYQLSTLLTFFLVFQLLKKQRKLHSAILLPHKIPIYNFISYKNKTPLRCLIFMAGRPLSNPNTKIYIGARWVRILQKI